MRKLNNQNPLHLLYLNGLGTGSLLYSLSWTFAGHKWWDNGDVTYGIKQGLYQGWVRSSKCGTEYGGPGAGVLNIGGVSFNVKEKFNTEVMLLASSSDTTLKMALLTIPKDKQRRWRRIIVDSASHRWCVAFRFSDSLAHLTKNKFAVKQDGRIQIRKDLLTSAVENGIPVDDNRKQIVQSQEVIPGTGSVPRFPEIASERRLGCTGIMRGIIVAYPGGAGITAGYSGLQLDSYGKIIICVGTRLFPYWVFNMLNSLLLIYLKSRTVGTPVGLSLVLDILNTRDRIVFDCQATCRYLWTLVGELPRRQSLYWDSSLQCS